MNEWSHMQWMNPPGRNKVWLKRGRMGISEMSSFEEAIGGGGKSTKENEGTQDVNKGKRRREKLAGEEQEERTRSVLTWTNKENDSASRPLRRSSLIPIRIKKTTTTININMINDKENLQERIEPVVKDDVGNGQIPLQIFPSSRTQMNFLNWISYGRIFKKSPVPISKVIEETFVLIKTSQDIFNPDKREMFNRELEGEVGVITGPIEDYREDLLKNALKKEKKYKLNNLFNMEINEKWRSEITDWIKRSIEKIYGVATNEETVHLAIYIFDAFLEKQRLISKRMYLLLGVTCVFIAAKKEEVHNIHPSLLLNFAKHKCREEQLIAMERLVLKKLRYEITPVTPIFFLQFSLSLLVFPNKTIKDLVVKLSEELLRRSLNELWLSSLPPSLKASAALEIAIEYVMYFYRQATIRVELSKDSKRFCLNTNAVLRCFTVFKNLMSILCNVTPPTPFVQRQVIERDVIEKRQRVYTRPMALITNAAFPKWH